MLPKPACERHDTRGRGCSKSTAVATVMLGRHSGIGSRIPRVPVFLARGGCPGNREAGNPRFPIWPGPIGNRGPGDGGPGIS